MKPQHVKAFFVLLIGVTVAHADAPENLLKNGGFETREGASTQLPAHWTETHHQYAPLAFTGEHYAGKLGGMMVGDGTPRMWRQDVIAPEQRAWLLSAMVKSENVVLGEGDYVRLYGHVIYKDKPYSTATHFSVDIRPGTNDWVRYQVHGGAVYEHEIEKIHVSVLGKFKQGRVYVDEVALTGDMTLSNEALLQNKIDDLRAQIDRVGPIDESVGRCQSWLDKAEAALAQSPPDVGVANSHWHSSAKMLSHDVWAAMFPDAMTTTPVEARMLYHGMGRTKQDTDAYLNKIELTGCNAVYLSFGSWMYVNYHSELLPTEPDWQDFDALTYFIDESHQRGLKVFGYFAPFYGTHSPTVLPGSIYTEHPEWFATGPDPNMPTFPDPANPEAVEFILEVYRELATRYQLDGIGLDYIRYPTPTALNYDEHNRRVIRERYEIDILEHENLPGDPEAWAKIQQYRQDAVGRVVNRVHDTIKQVRPDASIMACLISELDMAADDYGQNWARSGRWIDYASPMNYDDRSLDPSMLRRQREVCDRNDSVWIPAIGGMPEVHRAWTISQWADRVALQRELGADGIIIYRIGEFDTAVAAFFGKGPFYGDAEFPPPIK